jgi:hypothetical protein
MPPWRRNQPKHRKPGSLTPVFVEIAQHSLANVCRGVDAACLRSYNKRLSGKFLLFVRGAVG